MHKSATGVTVGSFMRFLAVLMALITSFCTGNAWALGSGGYTDQVAGTKALGMGNAFVALADDPSAVFYNPAGITQLSDINITIGATPIILGTSYTDNAGNTSHLKTVVPVVPNLYATIPLNHRWTFGLGENSPFGLETHWDNTGSLRYVATNSKLINIQVNPNMAYKVNDQLSVAVGAVYSRVDAKLESNLNVSATNTVLNGTPTSSPDGDQTLDGGGNSLGYNLGILYKPTERHRFGVAYRSELHAHITGNTTLTGMSGTMATVFGGPDYKTRTETDLWLPQGVLFGYAYKPGKWTFEADGEWTNYTTVGETRLTFPSETSAARLAVLNTGNPIVKSWYDSISVGLGTNYEFNDTWQARGGYFYEPSVIPNATWNPSDPENSRNGISLGGSYSHSSLTVDMAYELLLFNDRIVNNTVGATSGSTVNGTYKTMVHVISIAFTYRFGLKRS